jgi:hypothetical protein
MFADTAMSVVTKTASTDVTVTVGPCMKDDLINTIPFKDVTYKIGAEGFDFNTYSFEQVGDHCGNPYEVELEISGLPSMVTHDGISN